MFCLSHVTGTQFWFTVSVGYTTKDVIYMWKGVGIADDMKLSQFDLIDTPSGNQTDSLTSGERIIYRVNIISYID